MKLLLYILFFSLCLQVKAIINGTPDHKNRYLEVVALVKDNNYKFCTGVLIKRDLVLTAAHCIWRKKPYSENIKVHYGRGNPISKKVETSLYPVEKGDYHPNYALQDKVFGGKLNDVAWLKLSRPILDPNLKLPNVYWNENDLTDILDENKFLQVGFGNRTGSLERNNAAWKAFAGLEVNEWQDWGIRLGSYRRRAGLNDSGGPTFTLIPGKKRTVFALTKSLANSGGSWHSLISYSCDWYKETLFDEGLLINCK